MLAFRAIVFSAALAGLIVGLVVTVAQQYGTVPLILHAEAYEQAAETAGQASAGHAHDHGAEARQPAEGFERNGLTALFNIVDWIGFGLILGVSWPCWAAGRSLGAKASCGGLEASPP